MENNTKNKKDYFLPASILISSIIIAGAWVYTAGVRVSSAPEDAKKSVSKSEVAGELRDVSREALAELVLPAGGVTVPVTWGDIGTRMVASGVIDAQKFEALYAGRGGLRDEEKQLLYGKENGALTVTRENAGVLLNLLWAFGLANKNPILEEGPMVDPEYGGDASRFASTGGWTLAKGNAMEHYSGHAFIELSGEEQALVERASRGIFRPCCGNATYFPDCNHGMAMLGLLEFMAREGVSEDEMYRAALAVNSYWFPDTYLTLAKYFAKKDIPWEEVDARAVLGSSYSSSAGYRRILTEIQPVEQRGGGGCGV